MYIENAAALAKYNIVVGGLVNDNVLTGAVDDAALDNSNVDLKPYWDRLQQKIDEI